MKVLDTSQNLEPTIDEVKSIFPSMLLIDTLHSSSIRKAYVLENFYDTYFREISQELKSYKDFFQL